jgi:hypothetical protein
LATLTSIASGFAFLRTATTQNQRLHSDDALGVLVTNAY